MEMNAIGLWTSGSFFTVRTQYLADRDYRLLVCDTVAIVQLRTQQIVDDDLTSHGLLRHLLSAGSFRLVRTPRDDPTVSWPVDDENNSSLEGGEPGNQDNDEDDDYDEEDNWGRPPARTPKWFPPVTEPQEEGLKLLMGGEFGRIGVEARSRNGSGNFAKAILSRRSKLRHTPKHDILNVRDMGCA
jgi:hypothetical protein